MTSGGFWWIRWNSDELRWFRPLKVTMQNQRINLSRPSFWAWVTPKLSDFDGFWTKSLKNSHFFENNGIFPLKKNRLVPLPTIVRQIAFLLNKKCFLAGQNLRFSNSAFLVINSSEFLEFWWSLLNPGGFCWILVVSPFKVNHEKPANKSIAP